MTAMAAVSARSAPLLHDLRTLAVGDLVLQVAPPGDRKTIEIVVERDASLVLKAPPTATVERAEQFVASKREWIYRKLADKGRPHRPARRQAVRGKARASPTWAATTA